MSTTKFTIANTQKLDLVNYYFVTTYVTSPVGGSLTSAFPMKLVKFLPIHGSSDIMAEWSKAVRSGRILRAWVRIPLMSLAVDSTAIFFRYKYFAPVSQRAHTVRNSCLSSRAYP
jgi:hypothetical protein